MYRVLGKKTNETLASPIENEKNISTDIEESTEKKHIEIEDIKKIDESFNEIEFLKGAKDAFKVIVSAFQERNIEKVKFLLSKEVYENFADEASFLSGDKSLKNSIVSIKASIIDINILNTELFIKVQFLSSQKNLDVKKIDNKDEKAVDTKNKEIKDIWIFNRDLKDDNPNWKLTEVSSS